MITIDGSQGEGGGQILRSALALSLVTGQSFRIDNIRAGRRKPGLLRQHLTGVEAATRIGNATVDGAVLGSQELTFKPGKVVPGDYHFSVGTAGSATLVLQTILPALIIGSVQSNLLLEGGTHNPHAPPFDFLAGAFLPLINRLGPNIAATLERAGFYPAGGGKFSVVIKPALRLQPFELLHRGEARVRSARAVIAKLPRDVADRELAVVAEKLGWPGQSLQVQEISSAGPGNVLIFEIGSENVCEVFTGFGERGVRAETVAAKATDEVRQYLASSAPVGEHLADQLLVPLALAGGGVFRATHASRHTRTNIEVISRFLAVIIKVEHYEGGVEISVSPGVGPR
jgi:RNA 3'-terminal phosphate cyclase (ATP)